MTLGFCFSKGSAIFKDQSQKKIIKQCLFSFILFNCITSFQAGEDNPECNTCCDYATVNFNWIYVIYNAISLYSWFFGFSEMNFNKFLHFRIIKLLSTHLKQQFFSKRYSRFADNIYINN